VTFLVDKEVLMHVFLRVFRVPPFSFIPQTKDICHRTCVFSGTDSTVNPSTPELIPPRKPACRYFLLGILIFKGLTARRLYKSFGVKGLINTLKNNSINSNYSSS
jgi:hypothetical protein